MNTKRIYWKQGKQKTFTIEHICDCGSEVDYCGSAGCAHEGDITYFYQCKKTGRVISCYSRPAEDLSIFGWKKAP